MRFNNVYKGIVKNLKENAIQQQGELSQVKNTISVLDSLDDATLQKTGLDKKKKQITDTVTMASTKALQNLHKVLSATLNRTSI